jgi:hypothetical protein
MINKPKVKLYPTLEKDGSFELSEDIASQIQNIYESIDTCAITYVGEDILDDYYAGVMNTIETILATPLGQIHSKLQELLLDVQISLQANAEELHEDKDEEENLIVTTIENKKPTKVTDTDISDEEMLNTLED